MVKAFRHEFTLLLLNSFNVTLNMGRLPPSWNDAVISVLPKEGKNKEYCESYRPLSILIDCKTFTSIISKRIENFISDITDEDQSGFIKEQQTQVSIRRTLHIIDQIQKQEVNAMLASLNAKLLTV